MQRFKNETVYLTAQEYADLRVLTPGTKYVVDGVEQLDPAGLAAVRWAARGLSIRSRERIWGDVGNAGGTFTMTRCVRAPAEFDAVRVILTGAANSGTNTFKVVVAPSAKYNNGYQPVDAASANVGFTTCTFGSTDRGSYRNPGSAAATTALVQNVVSDKGTGSNDFWEGDVYSDWMNVQSLTRVDAGQTYPLLMVRVYGVNIPAAAVAESDYGNANPWRSAEPDHYSGYWGGDQTGTANPGAPNQGYTICVDVEFLLRGKPIQTIGIFGDSIPQGYAPSGTVAGSAGGIDGWGHQFVRLLRNAGLTVGFSNGAMAGHYSIWSHNRAYQQIEAGGITHAFVKAWSVNEIGLGTAGATQAQRRVDQIIDRAYVKGVYPVIFRNTFGESDGTATRIQMDAYLDSLVAQKVPVFDPRPVINDPATGQIKLAYQCLNGGGTAIDTTHWNNAAHAAVAQLAFQQRAQLGIYGI